MKKGLLFAVMCAFCLCCTACGDKDLKEARSVLDNYYTAFITGNVDQMTALTSERYRRDFLESSFAKDEFFLNGFKLSGQKCKYEIIDMQKLSDALIEAKLKIFTPEIAAVQKALQEALSQEEIMDYKMNGYTEQQIEAILLDKIYDTMQNTEFPLEERETSNILVQENGQWKVDRNLTGILK